MKGSDIKVGDKIIEFGQVYRVFQIKEEGGQRVIYYRPYFKNTENRTLVFSIPEDAVSKTRIRKPITKTKLTKLMKKVSEAHSGSEVPENDKAKELLSLNSPHKTLRVLKSYWMDKNDEETNFTLVKKTVLETAQERFVEEVAFVGKCSITDAHEKVERALDRAIAKE